MRVCRPIFAAFIALSCTSAPACGDFTFIHCSDIHVGANDNAKTDAALFTEMAALKPSPAFVINTGDVAEYGTDDQYAEFRDIRKKLGDIPMFVAPGNHDVRWNPRGKEGYTLGTGQPLYQSWDHENVHFVLLDSTVLLEHWGHISQEEMNWLKADLTHVGTERPIVIGFHHWVGRDAVQVDNEQALFELVTPFNVVLWLQGHGHADIDWNINGVPATMVKGLYQKSYDIIAVSKDSLQISKRFVPDWRQTKGEVLQDKDAPVEDKSVTELMMAVPLTKRAAPDFSAQCSFGDDAGVFDVDVNAGAGSHLACRIDGNPPVQIQVGHNALPTPPLCTAGDHQLTVTMTLADGRVYSRSSVVPMPGHMRPTWSTNVGGEVQSRLAKDGDTLYVSTMGNDLVALNTKDGCERFLIKTGGQIFGGAQVDGGTLYFGSADHFVYAADAITGTLKWKTELGGAVLASVSVTGDVLCVGTTDTNIYGLNAKTGDLKWTVQGGNMYQSKAATDGQTFFIGGWDNVFRAIDVQSGKELWKLELGRKQKPLFSAFAPAITAPAFGEGLVFVSTNDGILHALSVRDGKEAWKFDQKNMGYSSPLYHEAADGGRVYFALSDQGKTYCCDAKTGQLKWTCDTGSVIYDSSFCFGGDEKNPRVFIGNVNGTINSIDADSGKLAWQYRMAPGHLLGSPVADEHFIYMGSMSGEVIALPIK